MRVLIGGRRARAARKRKSIYGRVYTPSFTARALGINVEANKKQMKKILKQVHTGLEVRPGVIPA